MVKARFNDDNDISFYCRQDGLSLIFNDGFDDSFLINRIWNINLTEEVFNDVKLTRQAYCNFL